MELTEVTAVPIIIAMVAFLNGLGVPNRLLPVCDLVLGVGVGFLLFSEPKIAIVNGLVLGLAAAGLYRATKVTVGGE